jgi:hypothetical protein
MADERTPNHVNIGDELQVDALVAACRRICRYQRRYRQPLDQARINALMLGVLHTHSDAVGTRARRADQREISRMGWDGWNAS